MISKIALKIFESRVGTLIRWVSKAVSDTLANKLRFFLTILGILIGTGSVILLINVGVSAKAAIYQTLNALGDNIVYIFYGENSNQKTMSFPSPSMFLGGFPLNKAEEIKQTLLKLNGVEDVSLRAIDSAFIQSKYTEGSYPLIITDYNFFHILKFTLIDGRFPKAKEQLLRSPIVVLGKDLAKELFPRAVATGNTLTLNGKQLKVIGVVEFASDSSMPNNLNYSAFVLYPSILSIYPNLKISTIRVKLTSLDNLNILETTIKKITDLPFFVMTQEDLLQQTATIMNILTLFIAVIASISLAVGGIGIMNILLVSVKEKVKEIGLRKAVGATNKAILAMFLIQSLVYNIIGALLGILLGIAGSFTITHIANMPFVISVKAIILATTISFLIGIIFGLYPAFVAARLSPVEALREE